jgi:hypothetical protein
MRKQEIDYILTRMLDSHGRFEHNCGTTLPGGVIRAADRSIF